MVKRTRDHSLVEKGSNRWRKDKSIVEGSVFITKWGRSCLVERHLGLSRYQCTFEDYEVTASSKDIKLGQIIHPLDATVYDRGFIGFGDKSATTDNIAYRKWQGMMKRVYGPSPQYTDYKKYTVNKNWWCFQTFCEWYYSKCYKDDYELDKDLGSYLAGKLEYSSETCNLLPSTVNKLLKVREPKVSKEGHKFRANIVMEGRTYELGRYVDKTNAVYIILQQRCLYVKQRIRQEGLTEDMVDKIDTYVDRKFEEIIYGR